MFNFNNVGRPVAIIKNGKYDKKLISLDTDSGENDKTHFRALKISNDSKFQQVPNTKAEREILYITGRSGSGKSTYTRMYLEQYKKKYKNNPIYMFSSLKEDESLDSVKPQRFKINDSLHQDPIKVEELASSCVIFDDIDVISNKKINRGGL